MTTPKIGPLSSMSTLGPVTTLEVLVKAYAHAASKLIPLEYCPYPCAEYDKMLSHWPKSWDKPLDHQIYHACQKLFPEVFT